MPVARAPALAMASWRVHSSPNRRWVHPTDRWHQTHESACGRSACRLRTVSSKISLSPSASAAVALTGTLRAAHGTQADTQAGSASAPGHWHWHLVLRKSSSTLDWEYSAGALSLGESLCKSVRKSMIELLLVLLEQATGTPSQAATGIIMMGTCTT